MVVKIPTNYEQFTLVVTVSTKRPEKIHIVFKDADKKNTIYTDRWHVIGDGKSNKYTFYVRVPVCSKTAILTVYNEANGNVPKDKDNSFKIDSITKQPLVKRLDVVDFNNPVIKTFVEFCTKFCFNAGWLNCSNYYSRNFINGKGEQSRFYIEYLPYITSSRDGSVLNTPARICKTSGIMQVSQDKFIPMTVPMRMAIMLHEFSHYYVNNNISDEVEADLNALLMYLGLGYPRIEAYEAFLTTFIGTPSPVNKERYDYLNKFIKDFENNDYIWQK